MQYQEYIERVKQRAGLDSFEGAEAAAQATLTTLGEYLSGGEGLDLASQLPEGLEQYLRQRPPDRSMIFSLEDFLQMVSENEGVGLGEAEAHARAVMLVLEEAVSEGEMEDVRRQFPSEFDRMLGR